MTVFSVFKGWWVKLLFMDQRPYLYSRKANSGGPCGYMWPHWGGVESGNYTASGYAHQRVSVAPSLNTVGVRFGNDPVDTVAPKEWEAVLTAVGNYLESGSTE